MQGLIDVPPGLVRRVAQYFQLGQVGENFRPGGPLDNQRVGLLPGLFQHQRLVEKLAGPLFTAPEDHGCPHDFDAGNQMILGAARTQIEGLLQKGLGPTAVIEHLDRFQ